MYQPEIRSVNVIRYVTPLREGGSLPAIVEADDGFFYVLKFRGAGQGVKALIAELIGGEMARVLGLKIPEIVFIYLVDSFSKTEPDEEIQDLLRASTGLNLGLHFLSGAITFDPTVKEIDSLIASKILLLDYILMNVDRTVRNTNMLVWHKDLWLIDHGASLYFHHNWESWKEQSIKSFPLIKNHVLYPFVNNLEELAMDIKAIFSDNIIKTIVNLIPDQWLIEDQSEIEIPDEKRATYYEFLITRIGLLDQFAKEITLSHG